MAGVAGPMLRRSTSRGTRFLVSLLIGGMAASALLATLLFVAGSAVAGLVSPGVRTWLAVAALVVFGVLDLADRTPHVWRQVPQAFVRTLPPGKLGLVWGFDLSLLFTTQKTTSLTWAAVAGVALLTPGAAWAVLIGMTVVGMLTIALRSVRFCLGAMPYEVDRGRPWHVHLRRLTGLALVTLAVVLAIQGW